MRRIEVRAIERATFEGDQWEPVLNKETGALLGFHAGGTNCTVYIARTDDRCVGELFSVPDNKRVFLKDGLAVFPDDAEPLGEVVRF